MSGATTMFVGSPTGPQPLTQLAEIGTTDPAVTFASRNESRTTNWLNERSAGIVASTV